METGAEVRHVAVVENCVMTKIGLRQLFSCCSGSSYQFSFYQNSREWFEQSEFQGFDLVIYSVSDNRHSRQQSIHLLSHFARAQPDAVRVLLAEDEYQAKLIHHLLPVPLHAVWCKSSSVEKLQHQINVLMKRNESSGAPRQTPHCIAGTVELSPTERTIIYYMGKGYSIPEIAMRMARDPKTIRTHKFNAMSKLGIKSDTGLLCAADILRYLPVQAVNAEG